MRTTIFAAKLSQIPFWTPLTNDCLWYYWPLARFSETDIKITLSFGNLHDKMCVYGARICFNRFSLFISILIQWIFNLSNSRTVRIQRLKDILRSWALTKKLKLFKVCWRAIIRYLHILTRHAILFLAVRI